MVEVDIAPAEFKHWEGCEKQTHKAEEDILSQKNVNSNSEKGLLSQSMDPAILLLKLNKTSVSISDWKDNYRLKEIEKIGKIRQTVNIRSFRRAKTLARAHRLTRKWMKKVLREKIGAHILR